MNVCRYVFTMCSMTVYVRLKLDFGVGGGNFKIRYVAQGEGRIKMLCFVTLGRRGVKDYQNRRCLIFARPLMFSLLVCRIVDIEYQELFVTSEEL